MLVCVKERVLPGLGNALLGLVICAEPSELEQVVSLLNNILIEFGAECVPVMNNLVVRMLQKRAEFLAQLAEEGEAPQQATVRNQLEQNIFLFLQHTTARRCATILHSDEHSPYLYEAPSTLDQQRVG